VDFSFGIILLLDHPLVVQDPYQVGRLGDEDVEKALRR
jgi:hypothetical protein